MRGLQPIPLGGVVGGPKKTSRPAARSGTPDSLDAIRPDAPARPSPNPALQRQKSSKSGFSFAPFALTLRLRSRQSLSAAIPRLTPRPYSYPRTASSGKWPKRNALCPSTMPRTRPPKSDKLPIEFTFDTSLVKDRHQGRRGLVRRQGCVRHFSSTRITAWRSQVSTKTSRG